MKIVKHHLQNLILLSCTLCFSSYLHAQNTNSITASVNHGAKVFISRCALCHGSDGMGEGPLPLIAGNYPSTNLMESKSSQTLDEIREAVLWGGSTGKMSHLSPPWSDELTWQEIESVSLFVKTLRAKPEAAKELLNSEILTSAANKKVGQIIFKTRCSLCHGVYGEGDGKMRKIINNPPPANLRTSKQHDKYLHAIINNGGESLQRSPKMPPWRDELTKVEIDSVVLYIKTLRD